jgi:hypothetical protein
LNTKVADLATLFHFQKGYIGFFSTEIARKQLPTLNVSPCSWSQFFKLFHSKFEMLIYMKVVFLNQMDNFPEGRILSV